MAWKNLQQTSFADQMLIEHDALKELDDVHELIASAGNILLLAILFFSTRGLYMYLFKRNEEADTLSMSGAESPVRH